MRFIINAEEGKQKVTYYADGVDMFEQHANTALERGKIVSIEAEYIRETPIEVVRVAKDCGVPIIEMKGQPVIELPAEEEPEFVGQIVDVFEDFLDGKGITIENSEREGDDDEAIIYGSDYDEIADGIREIISRWISK